LNWERLLTSFDLSDDGADGDRLAGFEEGAKK
jgi:hypothetical protein